VIYDLAVVGLGFWGTCVSLEARSRGLEIITFDDGNLFGASRNAAGLIQRSWFKQDTIKKMMGDVTLDEIDYGIDWLMGHSSLIKCGELFSSYQNETKRFREDLYILPSVDSILKEIPSYGEVKHISHRGNYWSVEGHFARALVITAGWWSGKLLADNNLPTIVVKPLLGRALIASLEDYSEKIPNTYLPRPYKHLTVRPYYENYRIGDTTENILNLESSAEAAYSYLESSLRLMTGSSIISIKKRLCGIRPVCDIFTITEIAPRLVVATGGHRVGLALGPAVAIRALKLLGL